MTSDARAAARVVDDADEPLRFEEIRSRLRKVGVNLTVKQVRDTLDLAERLGLVGRVNRLRWGRVGTRPVPVQARRSRADAVIDAAARLLELPASVEVNRAVRAVLRLATEHGARQVLSQRTLRETLVPSATTPTVSPNTPPERKANGANHATDPFQVLLDAHAGTGR